jgi:DNA-3-methyladenine glycosylase I
MTRCAWVSEDPIYIQYHDEEWGVPEHDDDKLFEKIILDGAQAGLSWITILRKRDGYRKAFDQFDAEKIARYNARKIESLMQDPGIVRNRLKINAAVTNAQAYLKLKDELGSFDQFLWSFVNGEPLQAERKTIKDIPATSPESDRMSKALKSLGFKFVGSTICYAFMQAVGMVNDHTVDCHRFSHLSQVGKAKELGSRDYKSKPEAEYKGS